MCLWIFVIISYCLSGSPYVAVTALLNECRGRESSQQFVASHSSCAKYVFCDGDKSFEGECLDNNYFNEFEGNCVEAHEVECRLNMQAAVPSIFETATKTNTTAETNKPVGADGILSSSMVTAGPHVKPVVNYAGLLANSGQSSLSIAGLPTVTLAPPHTPQCPITFGIGNLLHLPNPTSCSAYFTCYNGIAVPMICSRNMYFNAQTSKCERKEQVQCALNHPVRLECRRGIYDFLPHPRSCEYYYLCANGFLMIMQCPFNFTWHYENRVCVHRSQAKCFSTTNLLQMLMLK